MLRCCLIFCLFCKPYEDLDIAQWRTQQQRAKLGNCGLFAIANMLDFCINGRIDKAEFDFKEDLMRPHLVACLEQQKFTPFPICFRKNKMALKRKGQPEYIYKIPITCFCGIAEELEDMVMCEGPCSRWFHYSCGNSNGTPQVKKWKCEECKKVKKQK